MAFKGKGPSVRKIASGAHVKKFGSARGIKIGGGANKKAGPLLTTPAKDTMIMKRG